MVEDDELIRMILVEELLEAGYVVREAASGDDAVTLLGSDDPPALSVLVTDIHMPGVHDGLRLADHVQERQPEVCVIYTTGRPDALRHLSFLGPRRYLVVKPYVPSDILHRIRGLLAA